MNSTSHVAILVVDADSKRRSQLASRLIALGLLAQACGDLDEALELIRTDKFQLVISDASCPACNGLTLFERVRAFVPSSPPFLLLAESRESVNNHCRLGEAPTVLLKPVEENEVIEAAQEILRRKDP